MNRKVGCILEGLVFTSDGVVGWETSLMVFPELLATEGQAAGEGCGLV